MPDNEMVWVPKGALTDIGDAIREKVGVASTYKLDEMPDAIDGIESGITPTGTIQITTNGTHDVTEYADADVNVQPNLQSKTVNQNGTVTPDQGYDGLSSVDVNVSGGGGIDKSKQNSYLGGNCYIKRGKITGFTSGSSIWQPRDANNTSLIVNWSQPFKIHARLTLNGTYSGSQALYGANATGVYFVLPTCEIRPAAFWFGFTTNGSSWTDEITITTVPVIANGEYEIDVVYDGTKVSVTVSDGTNTETAETTPSASLYNNSNNIIGFGGIAQNSNLVARYVAFDPDDTYIESNGSLVWGAKAT